MENAKDIKFILSSYPKYREKLFIRGYIITSKSIDDILGYPFYGNWSSMKIGDFYFYIHKKQHVYNYSWNNGTLFLIGHCISPIDNLINEEVILKVMAEKFNDSKAKALEFINGLTGNFLIGNVKDGVIDFCTDPTGMLFGCYGVINDIFYLSSHVQLIADLCQLQKSQYALDMEKYKYFYKYGVFFPGDTTQYSYVKRVMQNHVFRYDSGDVKYRRFYPVYEIECVKTEIEYKNLIKKISKILSRTIKLAVRKWDSIAMSLTGGMDSQTTLANANGNYEDIKFYSYISMPGDERDAVAAHKITSNIGVEHKIYEISNKDEDFMDIEVVCSIIQHNNGGYKVNDNDVRKRLYFSELNEFEVEIKSWISEIGRANYYKKFGLKRMPKQLSCRHCTSMYKIFTVQRNLAKRTDRIFKEYKEKCGFDKIPNGYDASDMYLWEFRYSAWGGRVITSEHSYSNEIFIPYNNRYLLELMLKAPLEKRISDKFHKDLISEGNSMIADMNIVVTNWNETKKRQLFEKLYFLINSILPF